MVRKAYENEGVGAACDVANEAGLGYEYCAACEAESPAIKHECLICGQATRLSDAEMMRDTKWVGKPVRIHSIGNYHIVEFKGVEYDNLNWSTGKYVKESSFTGYIGKKHISYIYYSLDEAIASLIAIKYNPGNRDIGHYFMKMIR